MGHTGYADCLLASIQHNLYDVWLCIQYRTPDDGHNTHPKNVDFCSKNKFEKLVHLFGFITRINPKHAGVHALKHYCNSNGVCASVGHTVTF